MDASFYDKRSKIFLSLSAAPNILGVFLNGLAVLFPLLDKNNSPGSSVAGFALLANYFSWCIFGVSATLGIGFGGLAVAFSIEWKRRLEGRKGILRIVFASISLLVSVFLLILAFILFIQLWIIEGNAHQHC